MDKKQLDEEMQKLQNGDEKAFETVYNDTRKGLFAFILSICKNYHTAEDIMQTTYIRMRTAIQTYKPGANAIAWLYTIAKNLTLNEINRRKREVFSDFDDNDKTYGEYDIEDKISSPLWELMNGVLNEQEMQIVSLYLISGFKHREIADMLKKPLGTVLWSYRNALGKVKKCMEEDGYNDEV